MANPSDEQQWKEQWQKALEEAEVTPSPHVWSGIEGKLAVQEGIKYRRGFLIYRGVAAALLVLLGGLSWYMLSRPDEAELPLATDIELPSASPEHRANPTRSATAPDLPTLRDSAGANRAPDPSANDRRIGSPAPNGTASSRSPQSPTAASGTADQALASQSSASAASPSVSGAAELRQPDGSDNRAVAPASSLPKQSAVATSSAQTLARSKDNIAAVASHPAAGSSEVLSPVRQTMYRVPEPLATAAQPEDSPSRPTFFAGLALAPGYFDPQFESTNANLAVAEQGVLAASPGFSDNRTNADFAPSPATGTDSEQELSFSYGFDVGMRLSDHWMIESGVDYSRFSTTSEARWAVADVASGQRYPYLAANHSALRYDLNANPARVAATPVNNAYQFIALPLKIGYRRAIDRLQFTVSSGVAANFFLGNLISATGEGFGDYRLSAADQGSPFRSLYYSGVVSGGGNFKGLDNYFLSLTPSYSFALTGFTREASDISSQPRSFGVNIGIEYQF